MMRLFREHRLIYKLPPAPGGAERSSGPRETFSLDDVINGKKLDTAIGGISETLKDLEGPLKQLGEMQVGVEKKGDNHFVMHVNLKGPTPETIAEIAKNPSAVIDKANALGAFVGGKIGKTIEVRLTGPGLPGASEVKKKKPLGITFSKKTLKALDDFKKIPDLGGENDLERIAAGLVALITAVGDMMKSIGQALNPEEESTPGEIPEGPKHSPEETKRRSILVEAIKKDGFDKVLADKKKVADAPAKGVDTKRLDELHKDIGDIDTQITLANTKKSNLDHELKKVASSDPDHAAELKRQMADLSGEMKMLEDKRDRRKKEYDTLAAGKDKTKEEAKKDVKTLLAMQKEQGDKADDLKKMVAEVSRSTSTMRVEFKKLITGIRVEIDPRNLQLKISIPDPKNQATLNSIVKTLGITEPISFDGGIVKNFEHLASSLPSILKEIA